MRRLIAALLGPREAAVWLVQSTSVSAEWINRDRSEAEEEEEVVAEGPTEVKWGVNLRWNGVEAGPGQGAENTERNHPSSLQEISWSVAMIQEGLDCCPWLNNGVYCIHLSPVSIPERNSELYDTNKKVQIVLKVHCWSSLTSERLWKICLHWKRRVDSIAAVFPLAIKAEIVRKTEGSRSFCRQSVDFQRGEDKLEFS